MNIKNGCTKVYRPDGIRPLDYCDEELYRMIFDRQEKEDPVRSIRILVATVLLGLIIALLIFSIASASPAVRYGTASYYTLESCLREGTSGIMANGRRIQDNGLTCASWDYAFGTRLAVKNLGNGKIVTVEVTDRGPAKRLYKKGRIIDLSRAAFARIADLKRGIIQIKVEVLP